MLCYVTPYLSPYLFDLVVCTKMKYPIRYIYPENIVDY